MNDLLGLPADIVTALTVIATGVLIPALTALLNRPGLSTTARRFIPIGLAAFGAVLIVLFRAGGPFAEQATTVVLLLAALVGIAQTLYALMPQTWKTLEKATSPTLTAERGTEGTYSVPPREGGDGGGAGI